MVTLVLFKDIEKVDLKITDNSKISSDCKEFITVKKKKTQKTFILKPQLYSHLIPRCLFKQISLLKNSSILLIVK